LTNSSYNKTNEMH